MDKTFAAAKRKPEKKNQAYMGLKSLTSVIPGAALLPIELTSQLGTGR